MGKARHNNPFFQNRTKGAQPHKLEILSKLCGPHIPHVHLHQRELSQTQTPAFERVVLPAFPVFHIWNERTLQWSKVMRDGSGSVMRSR